MLVQVKDVIVKKRIRKELQDIQALKESMSRYGLKRNWDGTLFRR